MIGITSTIRLIEELLGPDGWRYMGGLFKRHKNNPNIYAKDGRIVVIQGPISVSAETLFSGGGGHQVQDDFEDYLQRLQKELQGHIGAVRPQGVALVMQGGGSLQLPQWFID